MRNGFPSTETPPPCLERFLTEERQPLVGEECRGVWFFQSFSRLLLLGLSLGLEVRGCFGVRGLVANDSARSLQNQRLERRDALPASRSAGVLASLLLCSASAAQRGRTQQTLSPAPFQSVHQLWPSSSGGWLHPTWMPRTEALNHWRGNLLEALKNPSELRNWAALFAEEGQCLQRLFLDDANSSLCLSLQTPNLFLKKTLSAV